MARGVDDEGTMSLECHFLPPAIVVMANDVTSRAFPPVAVDDWCSQWTAERKHAANQPP